MLSQLNRSKLDPRHNLHKDLSKFFKEQTHIEGIHRTPLVLGNWNETCQGTSTSQKLCNEFGLVDIWLHLHPNHAQFSTSILVGPVAWTLHWLLSHWQPKPSTSFTSHSYRFFTDHRGFYIHERYISGDIMRFT